MGWKKVTEGALPFRGNKINGLPKMDHWKNFGEGVE